MSVSVCLCVSVCVCASVCVHARKRDLAVFYEQYPYSP